MPTRVAPKAKDLTKEWEAAVLGGSVADLEWLRLAGADLDARDDHGQTALMLAACRGDLGVVAWLVDRCAGLDATAKYGLSAIMLAAIGGHADVVRLIADSGASLTLQGSGAPAFAGKTALDLAIARGDQASVSAIEAAASRRRVAEAHFLRIAGRAGRVYDLGPEPPPGDIDGRSPAVVTWHDRDQFHLVASSTLPSEELIRIAESLYRMIRPALCSALAACSP